MNSSLSCLSCGTQFPSTKYTSDSSFRSDLYDSLASSNNIPSDVDAAALNERFLPRVAQQLSAIEHDLAGVEGAIALLLAEKIRLEAEKDRFQSMVSRTSGILSVMNHFPVEILSHIFQLRCDDRVDHVFDTSRGPWALSRVCRQWRSIALSLPTLWTAITIREGVTPNDTSGWKSLLAIAIERTRGHPLSVVFEGKRDFLHDDSDERSAQEKQWLLMLMQYSSRWASVSLSIFDDDLVWDLCLMAPLPLPILDTLHLHLRAFDSDEAEEYPPVVLFREATQLDIVRLDTVDKFNIDIPYSNLLMVSIHAYSCERTSRQAHQILSHAVQLGCLHIYYDEVCEADVNSTEPLPAIVRSPVRSLYLEPSCCNAQLDYQFTAPDLEYLHIRGTIANHQALLDFLRRSRCSLLEELKIDTRECTDLEALMVAIFELAPFLHQISLTAFDPADSDDVMKEKHEHLVHVMDKSVVEAWLPHLMSFTVDNPHVGQTRIV